MQAMIKEILLAPKQISSRSIPCHHGFYRIFKRDNSELSARLWKPEFYLFMFSFNFEIQSLNSIQKHKVMRIGTWQDLVEFSLQQNLVEYKEGLLKIYNVT